MSTDDSVVARLRAVARRRVAAENKAAELRTETDALILAGHAAGIPKQVLAREAGLTRQTVYTVLLKGER
jgi:hypothetical protein